jgi:hypothetical protein
MSSKYMDFLDYVIFHEGIYMVPPKVEDIVNWVTLVFVHVV